MAASAKKKKEKKKDFQKSAHKVGKAKAKPSNVTDTSFKAKAITIRQQSLNTSAPSATTKFVHYLSLVTHKSDSQRRDALAFLTTAVLDSEDSALSQPVSIIVEKTQPLILDGSTSVRSQLLKLFRALPPSDIDTKSCEGLLLYIRAAMTHMSSDVRLSAFDFLEWLLRVDGYGTVSCGGGWVKTLQCFVSMLGWREQQTSSKWTSASKATFGKTGGDSKNVAKQLQTLTSFLRMGFAPEVDSAGTTTVGDGWFPLRQTEAHLISKRSASFGYLNLFGSLRNEDMEMFEDREDRQRVFHNQFEAVILEGSERARKEAGEVGRAAVQLKKVIAEGMHHYEEQ